MARVVHLRVHGLEASHREALLERLEALVAVREWRGDRPWLAGAHSRDLFAMEYFRHAGAAAKAEDPAVPDLAAAGFVRLKGDETDALALLFAFRDLSEQFPRACFVVRDPDNPIAKLRHVELGGGRLPDGAVLETILVARPIYKRLPGATIEMYPPRALASAFGTLEAGDEQRRSWSFLVHGMRDTRPGFLEAEAEAMRIYRGLRFLE